MRDLWMDDFVCTSKRQVSLRVLLRDRFDCFIRECGLAGIVDLDLAFDRFVDYLAYLLALDGHEQDELGRANTPSGVHHRYVILCHLQPHCQHRRCNSFSPPFDPDSIDSFFLWLFGSVDASFEGLDLQRTVAYEILLYVCADKQSCWPFLPIPSDTGFPQCWPQRSSVPEEMRDDCLRLLSELVLGASGSATDPYLADAFRVFEQKHLSQENSRLRFDFRGTISMYIRATANFMRVDEARNRAKDSTKPVTLDDAIGFLLKSRDYEKLKELFSLKHVHETFLTAFFKNPGYVGQLILCRNETMVEPVKWRDTLLPSERLIAGGHFLCGASNKEISRALNIAPSTVTATVKRAWEKCVLEWLSNEFMEAS